MNTVAGMFELAKCIVTQERTLILTQDALDYMKAVDHLDQFVGLPPSIDEHTYALICRHRRLRLEYEIKLKGIQMQIMFGEATVSSFQRRVAFKKEKNAKLLMEKQKVRSDYLYLNHNIQFQIVLRRGLVEIPLTGDIRDFQDAILVPRVEIENINEKIRQAGDKKLHTMMQNMAFRRKIMATEWVHKKHRMEINDLIERIRDIESVRFTREMQMYSKGKSLGHKTEMDSFEQEIEVISAAFENNIRFRKEKLRRIRNQIQSYKNHNAALDKSIQEKNIDVCDLKLQQDLDLVCRENAVVKSRMDALLKRSCLVQAIQKNHNEILVLQTELELLRLKTYPTFKYKLINSSE
nr:cilia- and flagella-associated protein 43-like [Leptinotarsa decemlineata]